MYHSLAIQKVLEITKSSPKGLTENEVKKRQKKYGLNILPKKKKTTSLQIFLNQFKSPLVYILIIAALIAFFLRENIDAWIIMAAVLINAIVGFLQENKAEKTLFLLQQTIKSKVRVRREGVEKIILTEELVPGDIVILKAGDIVPADGRIIKLHNFQVNEALLTGESMPSSKTDQILDKDTPLADRENMVYQGTIVSRGKGEVVVTKTGDKTEMGQIALLIKKTPEEKTPLQKKIALLAKTLGIIIGSACLGLLILGLITGQPFLEMLLISVAVAVAGIPEGLLIAVTVCLTIGMQRLFKKKTLVKKLVATETLGSVTTIISDKTGTLTEGKMVISHILPKKGKSINDVLKASLICNEATIKNPGQDLEKLEIFGDSTDRALMLGAIQAGLEREKILKENPRLDEIPFESEKKWMATLHKEKNSNVILIKGAPEIILNNCSLEKEEKREIIAKVNNFTKKGLRVLAIGYKKTKEEKLPSHFSWLQYLGLVALKDPLREGSKEVISHCYKMGLRPILATGDHKLTALSIAQEVGIKGKKVIEGKDLDKISDKDLEKIIKKVNIFARIAPEHKIRLVKALKNNQEVVAMVGDGVNDAPAIKAANIGLALGSGSEVTKQTADIILLDDNFKTIFTAIKEGRNIFSNIKKIILYLLSGSFGELILIGGSIIFGWPLPVLAAQILWVNIIEDTLPALSLSYEKPTTDITKTKPHGLDVPLLDKEMKFLILIIGIASDLLLFILFGWALSSFNFSLVHIRTLIFVALGIDSLFYVYSCKSLDKNIWHYNPFKNKILNISVIFGLLMFLMAIYVPFFQNILQTVPLNWADWLFLIFIGLLNVSMIELGKMFFIRKKKI